MEFVKCHGNIVNLLLISSLILTFISDVSSQGVCSSSDLSAAFTKHDYYGTKDGGYSISCEHSAMGSYDFNFWRIQNGPDIVYTYETGTSKPGTNYVSRNLNWKNNNTVVFPSMIPSDIGVDEYKCTVQWDSIVNECTDSSIFNVNAKPVVFKDLPECFCYGMEERIPVTATDFLTSDMASTQFILNIDGRNITLDTSINDQEDGFKFFNSSIQHTASKDIEVTLFMVVGNSGVTVDYRIIRVPDSIPFLAIAVILDVLEVVCFIVLIVNTQVGKKIPEKIIRWIVFASSIVIIVIGIIFVAVIAVTACMPCGVAIAAVVFSAVAIPLGIVGVILAFKWESENNDWIRCKS